MTYTEDTNLYIYVKRKIKFFSKLWRNSQNDRLFSVGKSHKHHQVHWNFVEL